MNTGAGGMSQQPRMHPDQIVRLLLPLVEGAGRAIEAGVTPGSILKEVVLAGFLVGRGMVPAAALELVHQWRTTGLARELTRTAPQEPTAGAGRGELLREIEESMKNQATAAAFYGELMAQAQDEAVKAYIAHALKDEQKHYRMLGDLYRGLSGRTYEAQPRKVEFANFKAGLKKAMDDEYEAFEEYRAIYQKNQDELIRRVFFELMTDELEHATRFNYALQVL